MRRCASRPTRLLVAIRDFMRVSTHRAVEMDCAWITAHPFARSLRHFNEKCAMRRCGKFLPTLYFGITANGSSE
jgi:hypothetical protein